MACALHWYRVALSWTSSATSLHLVQERGYSWPFPVGNPGRGLWLVWSSS